MKKIFKCTECGKPFTLDDCELPDPRTINDGTKTERIVCDSCFESMWDNGDIVNCISCGGLNRLWHRPMQRKSEMIFLRSAQTAAKT